MTTTTQPSASTGSSSSSCCSSSSSRWVVATTLLVALEASSAFQIQPRVIPPSSIRPSSSLALRGIPPQWQRPTALSWLLPEETSDQESRRHGRRYMKGWFSRSRTRPEGRRSQGRTQTWAGSNTPTTGNEDENKNPTKSQKLSNEEIYEGLYEFLTRRTGEQAGEPERRRKRDRILDWMGSGYTASTTTTTTTTTSSSVTGGGSNLVQPIREDGTIIEEDPPRQRITFDKFFSGMPTLDEILTLSGGEEEGSSSPRPSQSRKEASGSGGKDSIADNSWFEPEKRRIQAEYEQIIVDIKAQIRLERQKDPEAMPENAEGVAESVARQEMDRMIKSLKVIRAKERLQQYETDSISKLDSQDMTNAKDEVVEKILNDAAQESKRKAALQDMVDDFERYQNEARQNSMNDDVPLPGNDLDGWALERMESMLRATQLQALDQDAPVSEILEQQIDDLRERIEKQSRKGPVEPRTMKEWQMYRAIANRLGREMGFDPKIDAALNLAEQEEQQVSQRLAAWKEYVGKEEELRRQSGLAASGPKMPFNWQNSDGRGPSQFVPTPTTPKSRREIRREVNMQALQAFESLVQRSDPTRTEGLRKQLEALRAELEPLDFVDVEEEIVDEQSLLPVDLSDIFGTRDDTERMLPSTLYEQQRDMIDQVLASDAASIYESDRSSTTQQAPPATPFFTNRCDDTPTEERSPPPPPKTPFFTDDSADVDVTNSKLGSVDEQKLLNMYRRAGARTKEEQDSIREQWEAFQAFERSKREVSGLADDDTTSLVEAADLKYDISEVMKGNGDFDAEKILSTIGPRPTRKKKTNDASESKAPVQDVPSSDLDPTQVSESLFRSVSAIGGGRVKDEPDLRDKQKAEFEDYIRKEEEMRQSLNFLDEEARNVIGDTDISLDDPKYAQEVLASIGPRPTFKRKAKTNKYEQEDSDEDDDDDDDDFEVLKDRGSSSADLVPDWLKKERQGIQSEGGGGGGYKSSSGFSGGKIDEVFDDDAYDRNLRQLHEYEQRRSGKDKQMGIDISDVLGKRARSSDDYADYLFDANYFRGKDNSWGQTSFQARKANLLEYVELSIPELNNLMDHRDSVYSSGVSQYLARVNKPFKEFGSIFRLEGVLLDMTGIHQEVWGRVATELGYKTPSIEEIRQASVTRPNIAVREIFYWANDVIVVRQATDRFFSCFTEVFDKWAASVGLISQAPSPKSEQSSAQLGFEVLSGNDSSLSEQSRVPLRFEGEQSKLKRFQEAWTITARELELRQPTNEEIAQSTFLAPEIAVRDAFRWTSDERDIGAVVAVFKALLNGDVDKSKYQIDLPEEGSNIQSEDASFLEAQYKSWLKVGESGRFVPPTPEEVLAASVLNDPEVVIVRAFGWTSSSTEAKRLADEYRGHLSLLLTGQRLPAPTSPRAETTPKAGVDASQWPTENQILDIQVKAWGIAATKHAFPPPTLDQIQLTLNTSPSDAVRRLLGWTYNFNEGQIEEITTTYSEALKDASKKYVKTSSFKASSATKGPVAASSVPKRKEIDADEIYKAAFDAWTSVAWQSGYSLPDQLPNQEKVQFAMAVGPEEAVVVGFRWTDSYEKAASLASMYRDKIKPKRAEWIKKGYSLSSKMESTQEAADDPLVVVRDGVFDWIKSLQDVEMACGVTSYLNKDQVDILLRFAGLSSLLPPEQRVTSSNGYSRDSQQMVGAALRIERRPDHCVVFDSSPASCGAAREVEMRSVAMVGPYPRYELLSADTSAFSFDELTAMNIRRLFGERVYDQPLLDSLQNQPQVRRKTKTTFWDPDE